MNMAQPRDERKVNMRITLAMWCVVCSISMAAMLVLASRKTIVIADTRQEQNVIIAEQEQEIIPSGELILEMDRKKNKLLSIPLENGIKAEQVVVENRYMDRELWIFIQDAKYIFYDANAVSGDVDYIEKGRYEARKDGIVLKMQMSQVMEYRSTLESGCLNIEMYHPSEMYEQIVVIDPMGNMPGGVSAGDSVEEDVTCQVAMLLQKKISQSDIKIYLTRTEAVEVSEEARLALVEETDADLYLQIGISSDSEKTESYGIQAFYNEEYYIPEFGNVEWADIVTRKVAIASSNRAIGLSRAGEDSILRQLRIPGAQVNIGFRTNEQEYTLLQQDSYQEKLAEGIAEAILEVYTDKSTSNEQVVNNEG